MMNNWIITGSENWTGDRVFERLIYEPDESRVRELVASALRELPADVVNESVIFGVLVLQCASAPSTTDTIGRIFNAFGEAALPGFETCLTNATSRDDHRVVRKAVAYIWRTLSLTQQTEIYDKKHTCFMRICSEEEHQTKQRRLAGKLNKFVADRFGGDLSKVFDHYDGNRDGRIDKAEFSLFLTDADAGGWLNPRLINGRVMTEILARFDNDNGSISQNELISAVLQHA